MSCEQEWYAYYRGKQEEAWRDADHAPDVPEVQAYTNKLHTIAAIVTAEGGDPEAFTETADDSDSGAQPPQGNPPTPPSTQPAAPIDWSKVEPDAITGAGEVYSSDWLDPSQSLIIEITDFGTVDMTDAANTVLAVMSMGAISVEGKSVWQQFWDNLTGTSQCPKKESSDGKVPICKK